jgi:hypothetical protein
MPMAVQTMRSRPKNRALPKQELSPLRSPCRRHHLPLGSRSSGDSSYGGAGSCFGTHSPNNPLAGTNSAASADSTLDSRSGQCSCTMLAWRHDNSTRRPSAFRSGSAVPGAPCRRRRPPGRVWRSEAAGCTRRSRPEPADGVREVGSRSQRDRQGSPARDRAAPGQRVFCISRHRCSSPGRYIWLWRHTLAEPNCKIL